MAILKLKGEHKPIREYYAALEQYERIGAKDEGAVRIAFQNLLDACGRQFNWTVQAEYSYTRADKRAAKIDGALVDEFRIARGYWEAKDVKDNLDKAIKEKIAAGYPLSNTIFQTPGRAVLYQNGQKVADEDIRQADKLVGILRRFFEHRVPVYDQWEQAAKDFQERVPELASALFEIIGQERKRSKEFSTAFDGFFNLCKQAINPNLADKAVEEMLIQHVLTERIFRKIFNNPEFTNRNVIAVEIEKVIKILTLEAFSRDDFLRDSDHFYVALEETAATIKDFTHKQHFLNRVYERFFQSFSTKVADTHGIVYTPQSVVDFMVESVDEILQREFGRNLSSKGVNILDPFVGTGNFIVRAMQKIKKTALEQKYQSELHCNEVMLLPYYIASMNIEHEYYDILGKYRPFEGICLVDTFELAEARQMTLFNIENTRRVAKQKESEIFVIIGNPPYNAWQVSENDNNKNRKYQGIDERLAETYVAASKATLRNSLYDPYVRAIRWASDRIGSEGVVAFVTNNSFLDGIAFDGMRYHLSRDFSTIYHINLRGNARTSGEKRRKEAGNIFDDQIRVSVGITFCIRKPKDQNKLADVFVFSIDDYLSSLAKSDLLQGFGSLSQVPFQKIEMNPAYVWLTAGLQDDYQNFISLGSKEAKRDRVSNVVFSTFSRGLLSNRDAWVYNFNITDLACNMEKTIEFYNAELDRYKRKKTEEVQLDNFLNYDESKISWGRVLKNGLKQKKEATFLAENIRMSLYRPFTKTFLFFDRLWNQDIYLIPIIFPNTQTEKENCIICVPGLGGRTNFWCLASNQITNLSLISIDANQCFPFYTYDESGNNRQENITDWALAEYRQHYQNEQISKWDIFYYIYGVLHHPQYRERYAANLRRELPRIPYLQDFRTISTIGRKLADLHVNYEELSGYELEKVENPDVTLNWQVEKMRLTKDRQSIIYNDFLTLAGIPSEVFEYKLGNRSALEWVIEEYQVSKDKRSGIINDPNRYDDPQYIVRLVEQVVAVSVATVQLVKSLPVFEVKNV